MRITADAKALRAGAQARPVGGRPGEKLSHNSTALIAWITFSLRKARVTPMNAHSRRGRPAIFLDRDGTLNVEKGGIRRPQELELIPGVADALIALREAGFCLVVVTNQSIIARGEASESDLAAVHHRLETELGDAGAYVDGIYVARIIRIVASRANAWNLR